MTEQILGQNPESTKTESGNAPQPIQNEKWWNDVQDFLARRQQEAIENLKKSKLTAYDYYRQAQNDQGMFRAIHNDYMSGIPTKIERYKDYRL